MAHDVTILVVDDDQTILELVQYTLRKSGYEVLIADSGDKALTVFKANGSHISCVITDCQMPGMNGIELAKHLLSVQPDLRVIFMSGNKAGLAGHPFLQKPFTPGQIRKYVNDATRSVRAGMPDEIPKLVNQGWSGNPCLDPVDSDVTSLTRREAEILGLLAQGYSTRRAAVTLGIAFKTVDCHRSRIYSKLGVHGIVSLVRYAIRNGLLEA